MSERRRGQPEPRKLADRNALLARVGTDCGNPYMCTTIIPTRCRLPRRGGVQLQKAGRFSNTTPERL